MTKPRKIETVILFGGAGLVGFQIARQVAKELEPNRLVVCALTEDEVTPVVAKLKKEFPKISHIDAEYGNLFVREEFSQGSRVDIANNKSILNQIFTDVYEPINADKDNIRQQNFMVKLIMKYKPDAVIDTVNTATGISYQDVKSCSHVVKKFRNQLDGLIQTGGSADQFKQAAEQPLEVFPHLNNLRMLDLLLVSQAMPQLIRHIVLLHNALLAVDAFAYIKVGTTGTGGMGINIPFTHGEDKPSFTLMAKTAVAFAHTGLLFLLARTPGPIIKEIKPGAMIGYRKIDFKPIKKFGKTVKKFETKQEILSDSLTLHDDARNYQEDGVLSLVCIDIGENGFFTRAEYEAITYSNLMEFVTPEEVARNVLFELCGRNTGKDVIAAIDSAIMDPSYLAGVIRQSTIEEMTLMEKHKEIPSIAIGQLGPPQLSKLLYETYLLEQIYSTIDDLAKNDISPKKLSKKIEDYILNNKSLQKMITSLGMPILLSDGKTILRGPFISIPESKAHAEIDIASDKDINEWAKCGWLDLRPENMKIWQQRAKKMLAERNNPFIEGSSIYTAESYPNHALKTGEVVGWIFVNEFGGCRVK